MTTKNTSTQISGRLIGEPNRPDSHTDTVPLQERGPIFGLLDATTLRLFFF